MTNAVTAIESVLNAYKNLPEVHAVALYGSRAKGTATEASDINIMIIESKLPSQSTRAHVLSGLADKDKPFACRDAPNPTDSFEIGGIRTNICYIPEDLVCERVSSVLKNRRLEDSIIVAILHESSILWDPKHQLQAWKNIVSPIPQEYRKAVVPVMFSEIASSLESLMDKEETIPPFISQHEQFAIVKTLYEVVYLANGFYFSMSRHLDQDVARFESAPEGFLRHIENILNMDCTPKGLAARWRRLCHLAQIVGQFLESKQQYNLKTGWAQLKRAAPFLFEYGE